VRARERELICEERTWRPSTRERERPANEECQGSMVKLDKVGLGEEGRERSRGERLIGMKWID